MLSPISIFSSKMLLLKPTTTTTTTTITQTSKILLNQRNPKTPNRLKFNSLETPRINLALNTILN